jgi:hypothetical protein
MKWKMLEAVYGRREGIKLTLIKQSPSGWKGRNTYRNQTPTK